MGTEKTTKLRRSPFPPLAIGGLALLSELFIYNWHYWITRLGISDYSDSLSFSWIRILCTLIILIGLFAFRPSSSMWTTRFDERTTLGRSVLLIPAAALCLLLIPFSCLSGQDKWLDQTPYYDESLQAIQDGNQYNHLADALLSGRVSLDLPVPELLKEMDNPYDPQERAEQNSRLHDTVYWDYAYYDGNYYCYFGVIPCLLTFVPFKAITGFDLKTNVAVLLFAWLLVCSGIKLLLELKRAYKPNLCVGECIIGFVLLILCSGILEQVFFPRLYAIPMLSALSFAYLGLAFWLEARTKFRATGHWPLGRLTTGSLCFAMTLGCRPQYILGALLAFPLFSKEIRDGEFFSKQSVRRTLSVIAPFVFVFCPIALYNYARFDSFTNFGAQYNLTGGDMTGYQFIFLKVVLQVAEYLFLPFQTQAIFPFICTINTSDLSSLIPWLQTAEPFYAGFIYLNPTVLVLLAMFSKGARESLKKYSLNALIATCLLIAIFDIAVAAYVSGVNMRYFIDFSWLLLIPTLLVIWLIICPAMERENSHLVHSLLFYTSCFGVSLYCWSFLGTERFGCLISSSPSLYQSMERLITRLLV